MAEYKVWIQTEVLPKRGEPRNINEPEPVFVSDSRKTALDVQDTLVALVDALQSGDDAADLFHQLQRLAALVQVS